MPDDYTLDLQSRRVKLAEQREARFQRAADSRADRESGQGESGRQKAVRRTQTAARAPRRVADATTSYSGNRVLAALLLAGFAIVAIRVVADYESQDDGTAKGKVFHPKGQLGPLPILAGLIMSFFALSFVAIGGGNRAKLAVITGGCIVLTLGLKSFNEVKTVSGTIGKIGSITIPGESGSEGSGASNANDGSSTPSSPSSPGSQPADTGSAASNALNAGNRALKSVAHPNVTGLQLTEGLAKAIADGSTSAVDQVVNTIKGWFK